MILLPLFFCSLSGGPILVIQYSYNAPKQLPSAMAQSEKHTYRHRDIWRLQTASVTHRYVVGVNDVYMGGKRALKRDSSVGKMNRN